MREELGRLPAHQRRAVRVLRVEEAEEVARRASVDRGDDLMARLAQIRDRLSVSPEAEAEYLAAEQARVARNEGTRVTAGDRVSAERNAPRLEVMRRLTERAEAVRAARHGDLARAAAHVDPPSALRRVLTADQVRELAEDWCSQEGDRHAD